MPCDIRRRDEFGKSLHVQSGQGDERFGPLLFRHVEKQRPLGFDAVGLRRSRDEKADVVLHEQNMFRGFQHFRFMAFQPHHLRQRPRRGRLLVGRLENGVAVLFTQFRAFGGTALIRPHDRAADGAVSIIEQHGVVCRTVESDGEDARHVDAFGADGRKRLAHRVIPVRRLLLRPAWMFEIRRIFDRCVREKRAVDGDRRDFAAARSEIDAKKDAVVHGHFTQACAGSFEEMRPRPSSPAIVQR